MKMENIIVGGVIEKDGKYLLVIEKNYFLVIV